MQELQFMKHELRDRLNGVLGRSRARRVPRARSRSVIVRPPRHGGRTSAAMSRRLLRAGSTIREMTRGSGCVETTKDAAVLIVGVEASPDPPRGDLLWI